MSTIDLSPRSRPIPFTGPMVRATLARTKTQTRRGINAPPSVTAFRHWYADKWDRMQGDARGDSVRCPYGKPGDRLWVREAWRVSSAYDALPPREIPANVGRSYEADMEGRGMHMLGRLRPGMFMPRWASRITLEVTGVRVERLQDISEADARAEGIASRRIGTGDARTGCRDVYGLACDDNAWAGSAVQAYQHLWEQINGAGSWAANPFVWVVEFRQ